MVDEPSGDEGSRSKRGRPSRHEYDSVEQVITDSCALTLYPRVSDSVTGRNQSHETPSDVDIHVQLVIKHTHGQLIELIRRRQELVRRISSVKQTIVGLANLFGQECLTEELHVFVGEKSCRPRSGITNACRQVLMQTRTSLTARDVCNLIHDRNSSLLSHHKDATVSVTTVLNRLVHYGEAESVVLDNGRRAWKWKWSTGETR